MQVVHLRALDDPRFADRELYRAIGDHERLRAAGLFLAEGRLVVARLVERHRGLVRSFLLNAAAHRALEPALAVLDDAVNAFVCDARDFETLTGYDIHRGCLALASRPSALSIDDLTAAAQALVVVEEVGNADNVGGIFRNAAAFGVDGVVLSGGCADPLYRKTIRTSMAAVLTVPYATTARDGDWRATLAAIRRAGFQLVALTPDPSALDLDAFACSGRGHRVALLVGAEGPGLTPESQAAADVRVRIPIRGEVDSLNVSVATGIALHRLAAPSSG
jgi:tRNA G18 (ribose-2'-O)-methylase SpoU